MARGLGDKKGTRVLYCSSCAVREGGVKGEREEGERGREGGRKGMIEGGVFSLLQCRKKRDQNKGGLTVNLVNRQTQQAVYGQPPGQQQLPVAAAIVIMFTAACSTDHIASLFRLHYHNYSHR